MSQFKRVLDDGSEVTDLALVDDKGRAVVVPQNITTKFREAFETYDPNGSRWAQSLGSGDLVFVDGNAVGASYLVISKDPLTAGQETQVTTVASLPMPIELAVGLHMSQRTVGQEFSVEVVSDDGTMVATPDIAIANVSQATTTLTVNTVAAHGLKPGMRIGIYGSPDSRFNYPSLVVAAIPSANQFTVTAGPMGNLPSVTAGPVNGGNVYVRSSTGWAHNAVAQVFENAISTNASFYVKTESSDVHPAGGTLTGNHSVTTASLASVQAINAAYTYAFQPTAEFRLTLMTDRFQWSDIPVDSTSTSSTSRSVRSQITPDPTKKYKLRFRHTNNKGLTIPVAQIVSVAKTGTTTATITTDVPHGLSVSDVVQMFGARDVANFPSVAALAVSSIVSPTQFTIIWGAAVTATSYGGMVARVQGGNNVPGLLGQAIASVSANSGYLTINGSANWSGAVVGDLVNLYGVRDNVTGATMGLDGVYRVRNISTTVAELEPIGSTAAPANLALTNCGGAVIRRSDARISYARIFEFKRERVEMLARPSGDSAAAAPVFVQNTIPATQSSRGTAGSGWWVNPDNTLVTDVVAAAITSTATTSTITPASPAGCAEFNVIVTAASGTSPTMDIGIEESDDAGTNWIRIYDVPRIAAAGAYRTPLLLLNGTRVRYVQTIGGASPSFTRSINRVPNLMMGAANNVRQVIDRAIDVNTLNSATAVMVNGTGATNVGFHVQHGAATTAAIFQLQVSWDGNSWNNIGNTATPSAGSWSFTQVPNVPFQFFRVVVQTPGAGGVVGQTVVTMRTY